MPRAQRNKSQEEERLIEREKAPAMPIPAGCPAMDLDDYLFFSIAGMRFCVPLRQINSVVNVDDTLLDMDFGFDLPKICRGFVRYRRQQVPLLDLRPKFRVQNTGLAPRSIGLICDFGVSFLALLVDFVYNLEKGSRGHLLPLPKKIGELGDDFIQGYLEHAGGGAFLINMLSLFSESDIEELAAVL